MNLRIPHPCSMKPTDMEPVKTGYHCSQCEKTVVDFRPFTADEIQAYFKEKQGQRVCGILAPKPVDEMPPVLITAQRMYKGVSRVFFAALLFVFGQLFVGCGSPPEPETPAISPVGIIEAYTPHEMDMLTSPNSSAAPKLSHAENTYSCGEGGYVPYTELVPIPDTIPVIESHHLGDFEVLGNMVQEIHPTFPGGEEALMKFLRDNIQYPAYEAENDIQGKVYVKFTIAADGTVQDPKILRGVDGAPNFDAEVLRIMKRMPNWSPASREGKNVPFEYIMPVAFQLE